MYCRWRFSYQEGLAWISLIGLTPPRLGAYPKPVSRFPISYVVVFLCSVSEDEMWLFILLIMVIMWPSLFKGNWMFCWYWLNCDHHCLNSFTCWSTCALSRQTVDLHWLHLPFDILEQCDVSFGTGITVARHNNIYQTCR